MSNIAKEMSLTDRLRLRLCGWRPSRNVWHKIQSQHPTGLPPNVRQFLAEFSGIRFPGRYMVAAVFDCSDGDWLRHIRCYEAELAVRLYPVAEETELRHQNLLLADTGILYELSLDSESGEEFSSLHPFAWSLPTALRCLLHPTNKVLRQVRWDELKAFGLDPDCGWRIVGNDGNSDSAAKLVVEESRRGP